MLINAARPRLLDLFCCAGGAGVGYHRAGFDVTGVDIAPSPRYPFPLIAGDAVAYLAAHGHEYDVIHASPPCQAYSGHVRSQSSRWAGTRGKDEARLIAVVRDLLVATGKPWIIENVYGARDEMPGHVILCGAMFGLPIARHRCIETSWGFVPPAHPTCRGVAKRYAAERGWEYRDMSVTGKGRHAGTSARWSEILGVTWPMSQHELRESIPPSYTECIGRDLLAARPAAAAA